LAITSVLVLGSSSPVAVALIVARLARKHLLLLLVELVLLVLELRGLLSSDTLAFSVELRRIIVVDIFSLSRCLAFLTFNVHATLAAIRFSHHAAASILVAIAIRVTTSTATTATTEVAAPTSEVSSVTSLEVTTTAELAIETTTFVGACEGTGLAVTIATNWIRMVNRKGVSILHLL
jgi:hypothetical protein